MTTRSPAAAAGSPAPGAPPGTRLVVHMAAKSRPDGAVSALCSSPPRAIDPARASWTLRPRDVTCSGCQILILTQGAPDPFRAAFGPAEIDPWDAFARTRVEARAKWAAIAQAAAEEKP